MKPCTTILTSEVLCITGRERERERETWQVGLRPEKTKPCTFPAKSLYGFRRAREKMGRRGVFLSCVRRTTFATFLRSISAKLHRNTCPGGDSRHMVLYSRKVSIKGSNFPKNRLFKGTFALFVLSLRVTGNVLRRLHCFHRIVDIPQIYPSCVTFAEGCTIFPAIHLRKSSFATVSAMAIPGRGHSTGDTWREAGH